MSYQLKLDEQLEALQRVDGLVAQHFEQILCATGQAMAYALCQHLPGVSFGDTTMEGVGFAGICTPFFPEVEGTPLPEALEGFDDEEAWA